MKTVADIRSDRIYKVANLFDPEGPNRRRVENGRATAKRRAGPPTIGNPTTEEDMQLDLGPIDPLIMAVSDAQMVSPCEAPADIMRCNSSDHYPPSAHIQ